MIKKGELFPINLYHYKLNCNCSSEMNIYESKREDLEKQFLDCPICKMPYRISEGLYPTETATLLFLDKLDDTQIPAFMLSSCTPEIIEKLDLAGKWVLKNKPWWMHKITKKINLFGKKNVWF